MRKKLNSESGLTLVEMLCATVILVLLTLLLGTGTLMAMNTYETIAAQNEVELLLSTAVDALTDELRYARDVTARPAAQGETNFMYTSGSYGHETVLKWGNSTGDSAHQLMAESSESRSATKDDGSLIYPDGLRVLSTGAYGTENAYKDYVVVEDGTSIIYDYDPTTRQVTFTVMLTVAATGTSSSISAQIPEAITIRCLTPQDDPETLP